MRVETKECQMLIYSNKTKSVLGEKTVKIKAKAKLVENVRSIADNALN